MGLKCFFVRVFREVFSRQPAKKNREMKAGLSNKYDIIFSLLQVCDCIENRWLESLFLNLPKTTYFILIHT